MTFSRILLFSSLLLFATKFFGQQYKEEAKLKADSLYKLILNDPSIFCHLEDTFSADKGSPIGCGEYGYVEANLIVEPVRNLITAENLNKIMPPTETLFGYHIIIPLERRGSKIRFKHILIAFDKGL
ncbi:peptidylprolyl isomerase [Parvicella tangerina]|uniref:Chaperone SurA n=1 Tax=Parvicella tangerina TaxID=2829795 RepID=A0A916NFY7_9FLAO|nr:peptidylprolyl isomerase [Parvicella tangerina]CAG5078931.1 Chaperone SurA [Parvicella tangerina]